MIYEVRGSSLDPLLVSGDTVEVFESTLPSHNDFVVFGNPDGSTHIKICIGVPRDTLNVIENSVHINNSLAFSLQNSAQVFCWSSWAESSNFKIPEDCYVVLGTSDYSSDSRAKGFILKDQIIGIAQKLYGC